jgi:feruloyl esterase
VSIWHGGADTTVVPANAREIVNQWTNVHGLASEPSLTETIDGYPRRVWRNADGEDQIEFFGIPQMAHGTPLAVGDNDDQCGAAGAFLLEAGISSSYHSAKFWGIAGTPRPAATPERALTEAPAYAPSFQFQKSPHATGDSKNVRHSPVDIGGVITRALQAAGLMKPI